ncbi:NAD(P)H-dependent oxidoreductase [Streptomyces roseoverticillatus]|uniref:NADPH-dependent FMN reductase n=1 Tax=Streptomyces roseoverticillatus TaxID=66429 RepID=UPI001F1E4C93|nr:NADPH-dependent FMN reductase [Streptomyces roseoverticillatus]MCF3100348.1 NAD(P)H-dependent oxidoreductase [Streptomyces roseoverticillatus]
MIRFRTLCVAGSPSRGSHTRALVAHVGRLLERRGSETSLADLAELGLPPSHPDHYWSPEPHPVARAREFIDAVRASDALVLGTPVYHSGYSGLLKSAVDLLPRDAFEGRAVALVSHAGGPRGSATACEQLRQVVKALGGWAVPLQVSTVTADFTGDFLSGRRTLDEAGPVHARCEELADQLAGFTRAMRGVGAPEDRAEAAA